MNRLNSKRRLRERGQGLIEYALILVLVAVVVIAVLSLVGPGIQAWLFRVASAMECLDYADVIGERIGSGAAPADALLLLTDDGSSCIEAQQVGSDFQPTGHTYGPPS